MVGSSPSPSPSPSSAFSAVEYPCSRGAQRPGPVRVAVAVAGLAAPKRLSLLHLSLEET